MSGFTRPCVAWSLPLRIDILVREDAVERRLGAPSPLLARARKHDDEVSTPRGICIPKTVEGRPEGFVSLGPECERNLIVGNLRLCVAPGEPQEVMGGHMLGAKVGRVFESEQGPLIVTMPQRPAGHLLERDRVRVPSRWIAGPGEEHATVRDHQTLPLDSYHRLTRQELSSQERCNLGVTLVCPLGDAGLPRVPRIH